MPSQFPPVQVNGTPVPHANIVRQAHVLIHAGNPTEKGLAATVLALLEEREAHHGQ